MSSISDKLLKAYKETNYHVYTDPSFTLHPDVFCHKLKETHNRYLASTSAVITAWNPYSKMLPAQANATRQDQLIEKVSQRGLRFFDSLGLHPSGKWPGEESLFILDIALEEAADLGKTFGQNAIVFATANAIPTIAILV